MAHYRFRPRETKAVTGVEVESGSAEWRAQARADEAFREEVSNARWHAQSLFDSDDFKAPLLKRMVAPEDRAAARDANKADLAILVADRVARDHAVANEIAIEYSRQTRTFGTALIGECVDLGRARPPQRFILEHGEDQDCFGPLEDQERDCAYYLFTRSIPQQKLSGETIERYRLRWTCVAEVRGGFVALHWDNFNWAPQDGDGAEDASRSPGNESQFPYWKELPDIVRQLGELLGCEYAPIPLHDLVLNVVWERYESNDRYEWVHERIRAEARGVALSASGKKGGTVDVDASGVEALTRELAQVAVDALGANRDLVPRVAHRMLNTLVRNWNPKSYQFSLGEKGDQERLLFRGHAYFGVGKFTIVEGGLAGRNGPDSFPHVKCWVNRGGSNLALEFLLRHLEP